MVRQDTSKPKRFKKIKLSGNSKLLTYFEGEVRYIVFASLSSLSVLCLLAPITSTGRLDTLHAIASMESELYKIVVHLFDSRAVTSRSPVTLCDVSAARNIE